MTLVDLNNEISDGIRYSRPSLLEVVSTELTVDGYPDATATLTIWRNDERYDNAASDTGRPEGILVKGRRAVYENSLFSFEGNPYAHWFSGSMTCEYIDKLALDYDEQFAAALDHPPSNPVPIITRSRDGLEHEHPFYKAVSAAIEGPLAVLVKQEEEKARQGTVRESARLRRTLDALGRDLGRLIDSDLREIDEDGLTGTGNSEDPSPLRVIPESPVLYMGEPKTISVVAWKMLGASEIVVEPDPEGVVELVDGPVLPLEEHPRRDDLLIARLRLRPLIEDEETYLTIRCSDSEVLCNVSVRPEREEPEPSPPETLQFERERYQLGHGKRRRLVVKAPVEATDVHGVEVSVVSDAEGIVVLGQGCDLDFDEDLLCYLGSVDVDPRILGAKATLTARLGELTASCTAVVAENEGGGPAIDIKVVDEAGGKYRALVDRAGERTIIKVLGGHPAIRRYLGPAPDFPHQDRLGARLAIAEIVAGEAARMVMEKKFPNAGDLDGPAFYAEHLSYLDKYLARCHKMMIADAEL